MDYDRDWWRPACDFCGRKAFYDGYTREPTEFGETAYMCQPCYGARGVGVGPGKGRRLEIGYNRASH